MFNEFALDLKVARRKSGLTQVDCAHLLDTSENRISLMENGKRLPTIREICTLSLIYGRSFESLFGGIFTEARSDVRERLATIPDAPKNWISRINRQATLNNLAQQLEAQDPEHHAG